MLKIFLSKTRNFFLLICMMLVVQNGFAQEATNYKLTVTTTPSTCQKNGTITMTVTKADGTPLDMSLIDNIQYDVRIAGTNTSVTEGFTITNVASQLMPGNYDAYVMITHKNAHQVFLTQQNVTISNEYVAIAETGVYAFRDSYTLNCVPTGAFRINVKGKPNKKYGIRLIESPTDYTGSTDLTDLPLNSTGFGSYTFEKLPAGKYVYQVYDDCDGLAIKEFTIRNFTKANGEIASDLPVLKSDVPYGLQIDNTCSGISSIELYGPNRKTGVFGDWNRFESWALYKNHYSYGDARFYDFFDYATVTREEVEKLDAGLISENDFYWRQAGEQGNPNSWDKTYLLHRFSSPYPTYADLRDPDYPKTPVRLYVRVRGSDCVSYINLSIPSKTYNHQLKLSSPVWDCENYRITVYSVSSNNTVCKRDFSLYEVDADGNQVGDVLLTQTVGSGGTVSFNVGNVPLNPNKKYMVKAIITDYEGVVREEFIELKPPTTDYLMRSIIEAYFNRPNCPWDENARTGSMMLRYNSQEKMGGMIVTLVEAPAGYDPTQKPEPGYRMLKVGESHTIPTDPAWINSFYPFAINEVTGESKGGIYVVLPEGNYKFRYESVCAPGKIAEFTIPVSYPPQPQVKSELQITTEVECDYIKVYPFRNQIIDYNVDKNGNPVSLWLRFSGQQSTSTGKSEFYFNPQNINSPSVKDFYLKVHKSNNEVINVTYYTEYTSSNQYWGRNYGVYPNVPMERGNNSSTGTCTFHTQQIAVPYERLTYNRDTYFGYRCKDGASAKMGIEGIKGVGPYTFVLQDITGVTIETQSGIPAGSLAYFNFSGPDIALQYKMTIKDDGCPGEEVYEVLNLTELGMSVINPYARKICTSDNPVSQDISPINGVDGVIAVGMMSYTWIIKEGNANIEGLVSNPTEGRDSVASGPLALKSGIVTPQKAVYTVYPTYGTCPGEPFDITLVVSPCINYWQGGVDNLWDKTDNWTEYTIPGVGEDVEFATEINNPYFVGIPKSGPAVRDLHVPVGDAKKIGNLINETDLATVIPAEASLTVNNSIIGSETPEQAHKLVVGAEADKANGTLIVSKGCGHDIYGTVQLYGKGIKGPKGTWIDNIEGSPTEGRTFHSEYQWQYFGVPVQSIVANPTFYGASIREYDEKLNLDTAFYNKWRWLNNESMLTAFKGYSITQPTAKTYSIAGKFFFCDTTLTMTRQASAVTGVGTGTLKQNEHYGLGQNLFGNSYTAAIDISKLEFPTEVEPTVYLYNTGRFHDWAETGTLTTGTTPQLSAGNWFAIPANAAEIWDYQIPSMQGFMLKFTDEELAKGVDADQTINIPYATNEGDLRVMPNTKPQLAPEQRFDSSGTADFKSAEQTTLSYLRVNLESASTRDALWLISQEGTTNRFDNGWDGRKHFGTPTAFIFTENKDGLMQVNTDKTIDRSVISFYANADTKYELTLIKSNLEQYDNLHLYDLAEKTCVALNADTTYYRFSSTNKDNVEKRFVILSGDRSILKDGSIILLDAYLKHNEVLVVSNLSGKDGQVSLFDTSGRRLLKRELPIGVIKIPVSLSQGVYLVNLQVEGKQETVKIVIR